MNNIIYLIVAFVLMLPGIIGAVLPVLPGIPYMFLIALIFGFVDHFQHLGWLGLLILGLITIISLIIDYFAGILGARYGGASKWTWLWGLGGLILGLIILPPFGGIPGLFIGIFVGEILVHKDHKKAARAATHGFLGTLAGMLINLFLSILFLVLFVLMAI